MNERIRELARRVVGKHRNDTGSISLFDEQIEKFAELIIRESALTLYRHAIKDYDAGYNHEAKVMQLAGDIVKQHFGVEE